MENQKEVAPLPSQPSQEASAATLKPEPKVEKVEKRELSRPYLLTIRNNTFEYIKDFSLNNTEQALFSGKTFDSRVTIGSLLGNMSYIKFLEFVRSVAPTIGRIRMEASHGYENYQRLQLSHPVLYTKSDATGSSISLPETQFMRLNQFLTTAVETEVDFDLSDCWDLKFTLMPEIYIVLYLWPATENGKEKSAPVTYLNQTIKFEKSEKE